MIYDIGKKLPCLMREFGRCGVAKLLREYTDDFVYSLEALFSLGFKTCQRKVTDVIVAFKEIFED